MSKFRLQKFIKWLLEKKYCVIGPVKFNKRILIQEISEPKELDLSGILPEYSFKKYFIPSCEILFEWRNSRVIEDSSRHSASNSWLKNGIACLRQGFDRQACLRQGFSRQASIVPKTSLAMTARKQIIFGMSIFDLKALHLYNHIFEKDPYYQARMRNTLIIGQVRMPSPLSQAFQIWQEKYEEDVLEHLQFDIFLGLTDRSQIKFKVYTGSEEGQAILEKFGYKNYEHIQFAGPIKEEGIEPRFIKIKEKLPKTTNSKLWQDLTKRCIECGKCTLVCPTCFCFDINNKLDLKKGNRIRCWSSCFYNEFSQIAGDYKFLPNTQNRIYNWYYHKFVRVMDEYSFPGCVGCGRCARTCPAGIEIAKILKKLG